MLSDLFHLSHYEFSSTLKLPVQFLAFIEKLKHILLGFNKCARCGIQSAHVHIFRPLPPSVSSQFYSYIGAT